MPTIEVCLSPELIGGYDLKGKISVVVDVLRATSCMAAGLGSGVDHIVPFKDAEECKAMKSQGYFTAGERNGQKIPGMDMGNSPFEYMAPEMKGQKVATTTTNGTKCIHLSADADETITGSFLNISAVARFLIDQNKPVVIFCAGWKGKVNLEDSLFAGNLLDLLSAKFEPIDDSSVLMLASYETHNTILADLVARSEHAKRLAAFNIVNDIEYCARKDEFDVVPIMKNGRLVKA
ncbi:MAG: 2-phosphosulfolactate phosphatase [Cyclobacteriaceae bacterium]|nr:2-phosphosulfolactate phosphatase [Cyclobacteriaceae bacterium]